jgi:hypothetical protein
MSRSRARARLAMPLLLLLWPQTLLVAVTAILLDTICWPFVWFARRRVRHVDVAPPTRNASVIVLNWNGWHFLEHLLPTLQIAVARAPGDHEVIVVDNGSTDGSADKVAELFPWARVVRLPRNLFFIRGNRAGVEAATRDILVFLNNDMTVEPDFLVRLLERFGEPDLFAVAARIQMHGRRVETGCTRSFFKRGAFRLVHVDPYPAARVPTFWPAAAAARSTGRSTSRSVASKTCTNRATSRTSACRTRPGSAAGASSTAPAASCTTCIAARRRRCSVRPAWRRWTGATASCSSGAASPAGRACWRARCSHRGTR